jgi:hypothetical protein
MKRIGMSTCFAVLSVLAFACSAAPQDATDETGELAAGGATVSSPIIGGTSAGGYQEAVLLDMYKNGQLYAACSASLIAPRVVLTAGHCVDGTTSWRVTAPYASNQRSTSSSGVTYDWAENGAETVNPNHHDIGLVFLDTAITLSSYPTLATSPVADNSQIVNIGRIGSGTLSNSALFVGKPVTIKGASSSGYPFDYISTDIIESGDSGGPDEIPGTHTIVSVNSGAGGGTQVLARVDLLSTWIQQQIAAHGGGGGTGGGTGGGGTDAGTGGGGTGGGGTCSGTPEAEPNDTYTRPNALGAAACGAIGSSTDQDWFTWSVPAAGVNYDLKLAASGDAQIQMWKLVNGSYSQVANTSATEIAHASSGAGTYVLAVFSPSSATQSYKLTLAK